MAAMSLALNDMSVAWVAEDEGGLRLSLEADLLTPLVEEARGVVLGSGEVSWGMSLLPSFPETW